MKALMTIFQSIGVMAVLMLLYAVLLVGFEKKIIFHPAKFPEGYWNPVSLGLKAQDISFQSVDGVNLHGWYVPSGHSSHSCKPSNVWYLPTGHVSHSVKPSPAAKWPAVQGAQV